MTLTDTLHRRIEFIEGLLQRGPRHIERQGSREEDARTNTI